MQNERHAADLERERRIGRGDQAGGSQTPSGLPPRSATPSAPSSSTQEFIENRRRFAVIHIFHAGMLTVTIYIRISYPDTHTDATMNSAKKSAEMTSRLTVSVEIAASVPWTTIFNMPSFKYRIGAKGAGAFYAEIAHARPGPCRGRSASPSRLDQRGAPVSAGVPRIAEPVRRAGRRARRRRGDGRPLGSAAPDRPPRRSLEG